MLCVTYLREHHIYNLNFVHSFITHLLFQFKIQNSKKRAKTKPKKREKKIVNSRRETKYKL